MARPLRTFCLHRIRSGGGGGGAPTAAPPSICGAKEAADSSGGGGGGEGKSSLKGEKEDEEAKKSEAVAVVVGRKVMVAADGGSEEARTALHWVLSHAVRPCDTLVLLDVVRGGGGGSKNRATRSKRVPAPGGDEEHLPGQETRDQREKMPGSTELRLQAKIATDSGVGGLGACGRASSEGTSMSVRGRQDHGPPFPALTLIALCCWAHARAKFQDKLLQVRVELSLAEGKDRGPAIVEAARKQGVSLLVVGQKKRSVTWRLLSMWMAGVKGAAGAAEHAACMALAVRRKSRRGGGYLIITRRQRDFWLLA
ncbi:uncharacterized protein C2845_PM05G17190 [Panicum miliaceum]|uniref:UspA domain-containing protein n=1 Tax=Panicum miliaceum TaxID=4540 RepID=A0A3L6STE7_PANMI|nr:uncharacterized protein C2845_PM05G17190 [Panicum miliaceum]